MYEQLLARVLPRLADKYAPQIKDHLIQAKKATPLLDGEDDLVTMGSDEGGELYISLVAIASGDPPQIKRIVKYWKLEELIPLLKSQKP